MFFYVAHSVHIVDNLLLNGVVVESIQRKIAPLYIFFNRSKVVAGRAFCDGAERTDFKNFCAEYDMDYAESLADYT